MPQSLSVVVPLHNGAEFIGRCIDSILSSAPSAELIVVENGSQDGSFEAITQIAAPRIKIARLATPNRCAARNLGARLATGRFLTFVDQDDELKPAIAEALTFLESKAASAVICEQSFSPEEKIPPYFLKAKLSGKPMYHPMTLVTTRAAFFEIGGFDESLNYSEDMELVSRYRNMEYLPVITLLRHFHEFNGSRDTQSARAELLKVLQRRAKARKDA